LVTVSFFIGQILNKKMSRPLWLLESNFYQILQYNVYNIVQTVELSGFKNKEKLKKAALLLLQKYEVLQSGIILKENVPHFAAITEPESHFLKHHYVEILDGSKNWKQVFETDLKSASTQFMKGKEDLVDYQVGLLWKVTFIFNEESSTLQIVLTMSHIIADGKSLCIFMGDLINFLQSEEEIIQENVKISLGLDNILEDIKLEKKESEKKKFYEIQFDIEELKESPQQNVIFKHFSGFNLLKVCKEKQITINSFLLAVFLKNFVEHYSKCETDDWISTLVPICLRRTANLDPKSIGLHISQLDIEIQMKKENEDIWNFSKEIQQSIKNEIEL
jgi:hypothetical protein